MRPRHFIATLALTLAALGVSRAAEAQFYSPATQYNSDPRAIRSAQSNKAAPLDRATEQALQAQFGTGRNDAFGALSLQPRQPTAVVGETARIATTARPPVADLLGTGGAQDRLAQRIYTPGGYTPRF